MAAAAAAAAAAVTAAAAAAPPTCVGVDDCPLSSGPEGLYWRRIWGCQGEHCPGVVIPHLRRSRVPYCCDGSHLEEDLRTLLYQVSQAGRHLSQIQVECQVEVRVCSDLHAGPRGPAAVGADPVIGAICTAQLSLTAPRGQAPAGVYVLPAC